MSAKVAVGPTMLLGRVIVACFFALLCLLTSVLAGGGFFVGLAVYSASGAVMLMTLSLWTSGQNA